MTRCKISAVGYIYFTTIAMRPKKPVCGGIRVCVCVCVCVCVHERLFSKTFEAKVQTLFADYFFYFS